MSSVTQYIGARYVPIFANPLEWDNTRSYEPLTIVIHQGNSYTSRQSVPTGIDINNDDYWVSTGNYNAQIEQYRAEVMAMNGRVTELEKSVTELKSTVTELKSALGKYVKGTTYNDIDTNGFVYEEN